MKTKKYNIKKENLLQSIINLASTNDLLSMSVRDICKQLNISIGSYYYYFKDKSDMFVKIFSTIEDYIFDECDNKLTQDWKENIIIIMKAFCEYNKRGAPKIIFIAQGPAMAKSEYILLYKEKYSFNTIKHQIDNAMVKGDIKIKDMTSEEITYTIFSIARGNILEWARTECTFDIDKRINNSIEIFIKGLCVS